MALGAFQNWVDLFTEGQYELRQQVDEKTWAWFGGGEAWKISPLKPFYLFNCRDS